MSDATLPQRRLLLRAGKALALAGGLAAITVPVRLTRAAGPGPRELKGRVVYQICDWDQCLNGEVPFQLRLRVIDGVSAANPVTR